MLKFLITSGLLLFTIIAFSQQNEKRYDFKNAGENWENPNGTNLQISDEKFYSEGYSLKITPEDAIDIDNAALYSIDTKHTIQKVRIATNNNKTYIVASAYEGTVIGVGYDGITLWKNKLSGFMVHDMWCEDITADGNDEILVANADGTLYCLSNTGKLMWQFKMNDAPMYAVTVINKGTIPYVVCGGIDMSIYYLSTTGTMLKEIDSSTYSVQKPWGSNSPPSYLHNANFLRKIVNNQGEEILVLHGSLNHMQAQGALYQFEAFADAPFRTYLLSKDDISTVVGEFKHNDLENGKNEIILGTSGARQTVAIMKYDLDNTTEKYDASNPATKEIVIPGMSFGYRVTQVEVIPKGDSYEYLILVGNQIYIIDEDFNLVNSNGYTNQYAYNDLWKDTTNDKLILASSQSGGSCIHILNTKQSDWETAFINLDPPGKIQEILKNTEEIRTNLAAYTKPAAQNESQTVYLMTEKWDTPIAEQTKAYIEANHTSPVFLNSGNIDKEDWDRSEMENEVYKNKRDGRQKYILTQEEVLEKAAPKYTDHPGYAYWGGHGNDPYMYQRETSEMVVDQAAGKKTVLIYPEMADHSTDFEWVLNDLFYPMAENISGKNANIFVRNKHIFWLGPIHSPMWERLISGEFSDVFVPGMEETTDKSMELSLAGRMGVWASGSVDNWGARCARDNPSFDRSRQHSHQELPNGFLRNTIYSLASGATFINNFNVDQDYMSLYWELIAKGALYIPKRKDIVSFSPVHLSMINPDDDFVNEGENVKWNTFYDEEKEANTPMVFSHLNGTWMAAPVTEWDFSRYAANQKERRQNFIPSYNNGMVLITPRDDESAPRGVLTDHLHPLYHNIMSEYISDGKNYYSSDLGTSHKADEYYTTIEADIKSSAAQIPITVEGTVGWVVAQTSANNLRLTLIDGGYLNPSKKTAIVKFNTINPVSVTDILNGETFGTSSQIEIEIPCGAFRFIDIELSEAL